MLEQAKKWARAIRRDVVAVWIAARDPRVPWYAKALALAVAAYALSPIDLIPDFIPVLGYLDDLIIVPLGILLVVRLIPAPTDGRIPRASRGPRRAPAQFRRSARDRHDLDIGGVLLLWWLWPVAGLKHGSPAGRS